MRATPVDCLALALTLLAWGGPATAQELWAIQGASGGGESVAWIDPTTGATTLLSGGQNPPDFFSTVVALDPLGQRMLTVDQPSGGGDWHVYTLSLRDGAVLSGPPIPGTDGTGFPALEYDERAGLLYAIQASAANLPRLCRIDLATGALTPLGTGAVSGAFLSYGAGALDAGGHRFFALGELVGENETRIFTFDTGATTGTGILASPVLTGAANSIADIEYDPQENVLYGTNNTGTSLQLVRIDPATGAVVALGPGVSEHVLAERMALDPTRNRLFVQGLAPNFTPILYTFDTLDGSLDASPHVTPVVDWIRWRDAFPAKGDFDRDGQTDLLLRNSSNVTQAWLMNGTTRAALVTLTPTPTADEVIAGVDDFDHDGFEDLVVYRPSSGTVELWRLGGPSGTDRQGAAVPLLGASPLPSNWKLSATGDFNRDGWPDLLWRNTTTQKLVVWALVGATKIGNVIPSPDQAVDANWEVEAALDFNRDGNRDLLWYNSTSGRIVTWNLDHLMVRSDGNFTNPMAAGDNNWQVVAGGDYGVGPDGPDAAAPVVGSNDLVWRNATSGKLVVWHLDLHRQRTAGVFTTPDSGSPTPTNWNVVGPR